MDKISLKNLLDIYERKIFLWWLTDKWITPDRTKGWQRWKVIEFHNDFLGWLLIREKDPEKRKEMKEYLLQRLSHVQKIIDEKYQQLEKEGGYLPMK